MIKLTQKDEWAGMYCTPDRHMQLIHNVEESALTNPKVTRSAVFVSILRLSTCRNPKVAKWPLDLYLTASTVTLSSAHMWTLYCGSSTNSVS